METTTYKWQLLRGSRKCKCPWCGHKTLVPYVLAEDNTTEAGEAFGRCDREHKCGYHAYPDGERTVVRNIEPRILEPMSFDPIVLTTFANPTMTLKAYIRKVAEKYNRSGLGAKAADRVFYEYNVTSYMDGVVFWQISASNLIRAGKWMRYDANGHRIKDGKSISWCHKMPKFAQFLRGEELKQCYFGEHLLTKRPTDKVKIVESEKTALIMATIAPQFVWLACGGAQGIKNDERAAILRGREVELLPDNGKYVEWLQVANKRGWNISSYCEVSPIFAGCDIADYYVI